MFNPGDIQNLRGSTGMGVGSQNTGRFKEKIPKGYSLGRIQQFSPEMMDLFQQLFGHLGPESYLSRLAGGDEEIFKQIEAPSQRQFAGEIGNLASRFSGMGLGGRRSGGFQHAATDAASNFALQLGAQRQALQRQALQDIMGFSNQLLQQRPFETTLTQKEQSPWADIGGRFAAAIPGAIAGLFTGGPAGAAIGGLGGFASGGGQGSKILSQAYGLRG